MNTVTSLRAFKGGLHNLCYCMLKVKLLHKLIIIVVYWYLHLS